MAAYVRQLSTAGPPPGELPTLKAALRAVYKRVHPDLFQDFQPAKARASGLVWSRTAAELIDVRPCMFSMGTCIHAGACPDCLACC